MKLQKRCNGCGENLPLQDFITSPTLEPVGFQVNAQDTGLCLYFYVHRTVGCQTTVVVTFEEIIKSIQNNRFQTGLGHQLKCDGHFVRYDEPQECFSDCACQPYRLLFEELSRSHNEEPEPLFI